MLSLVVEFLRLLKMRKMRTKHAAVVILKTVERRLGGGGNNTSEPFARSPQNNPDFLSYLGPESRCWAIHV